MNDELTKVPAWTQEKLWRFVSATRKGSFYPSSLICVLRRIGEGRKSHGHSSRELPFYMKCTDSEHLLSKHPDFFHGQTSAEKRPNFNKLHL